MDALHKSLVIKNRNQFGNIYGCQLDNCYQNASYNEKIKGKSLITSIDYVDFWNTCNAILPGLIDHHMDLLGNLTENKTEQLERLAKVLK